MPAHSPNLVPTLIAAHYGFLSRWPGFARLDVPGATVITDRLIGGMFRNHVTQVYEHLGG